MVEDRLNGLALLHIYREINVGRFKILDKFDTVNRGIGALVNGKRKQTLKQNLYLLCLHVLKNITLQMSH
jgi:hypothetical protein